MNGKICIAVLLYWWSSWAWGFIPPATFVLQQIAQKNPLKNIHSIHFNAMVSTDAKKEFAKLTLSSQGLSDGQRPIDLYALHALLKAKNSSELKTYLGGLGIDMNVITLGFFGNEPVYIIGAKPGDTKSPQLWVDKSNWLIVKEMHKNREIIFDKWQALSNPAGAKFPRLINIKTDQEIKIYAVAEVPAM